MTGLIFSLVAVVYINCPASQLEVGRYDTYRKSITVCQNYEEDNYVLFHEVYHHIRTLLSEEEKELRTKNINYGGWFASKYARTTYEESFAETGRVYLQNKGKILDLFNTLASMVLGAYFQRQVNKTDLPPKPVDEPQGLFE